VSIVVVEPAAHAFLFCLVSAVGPALVAGNCIIVRVSSSKKYTGSTVPLPLSSRGAKSWLAGTDDACRAEDPREPRGGGPRQGHIAGD
jgi:hypothetical protein